MTSHKLRVLHRVQEQTSPRIRMQEEADIDIQISLLRSCIGILELNSIRIACKLVGVVVIQVHLDKTLDRDRVAWQLIVITMYDQVV